ncbi:restriction endonuclease subunit S [Latilactobacillus curvatus]|uniref:restriction endonuclease subunit S n=1 Tax=Latilactobacillus curvatus TaxID=28038 RepID=UPI0028B7C64F|nr:restriction endonuclease subunit S [Latilactobacillus curvatus]MDT7016237.1 restriction endonuclease subunit S [Latilactobacillus curvatus]
MPEKWEKVKISDIAKIKYGKDHKKLEDGNIPVYGTGGIMRYVDTSLYSKKSVLIPRKGSLGNLFFVKEPFWTVDTLFYTEIDESRIMPEYLYYKLKTYDLANMNVGSAVPSLTTAILNPIELELPALETQAEIVKTLGAIDEKIENNKKINHHLAEMAESIWKEKYANLKPNSTLGNFFPIITGKKDANVARGGQYPFFSCSQGISYTDAYSFEGNAILLAGNGDFNVKTYNGKFEAYQRTYVLIPNNEYRLGFLYYAIKHFLSDITAGDRGSVIKYITKGDIENLNLYMPDDESDFELFNQFVSNTAQNNAEIERLTETRDTLLPKLMSGELSVID